MTAGARNLADQLGLRPLRWWERVVIAATRPRPVKSVAWWQTVKPRRK